MTRFALLVALAVIALGIACGDGADDNGPGVTPSVQPTEQHTTETPGVDLTTPVGPDAVWPVPDGLLQPLQACQLMELECVRTIMDNAGATEAAIDFFAATGWFLTELHELGVIDLGVVTNPWRANANTDWVMLNGEPPAVFAADVILVPDSAGDAFNQLRATAPDLTIWTTDAVYESASAIEGGGQSFIYQYSLNDGCHACATGYFQRASLNFDADSSYQGPQLIDVCLGPTATAAADGPAVDTCPPQGSLP